MRKIFAVILAAALAVLGIVYLIAGIVLFITPINDIPKNYNTGIASIFIIIGCMTIICLIGTIGALVRVWNRNKANERALFSLGIMILGEGIASLLLWISYKDIKPIEQVNSYLATWIVELIGGSLIFVASLEFVPVGIRRIFGVLGSLVGIVIYSMTCASLSGSGNAISWAIVIGCLIVSLLGLILSLTLKDKFFKAKN